MSKSDAVSRGTQTLDVIGPISGADRKRTGHLADYHVHAYGCADTNRYHAEHWQMDAASQTEVADEVFADIMAENGSAPGEYRGEFWFAPCCDDLPVAELRDWYRLGYETAYRGDPPSPLVGTEDEDRERYFRGFGAGSYDKRFEISDVIEHYRRQV